MKPPVIDRLARLRWALATSLLACVFGLTACGGADGGATGATDFTLSGTITGLSSNGLVLLNNGGNGITVANAASRFSFTGKVARGAAYAVSVGSQPGAQDCSVANASGTAQADVSNVVVSCGPMAPLTLTAIDPANEAGGVTRVVRPVLSFSSPLDAGSGAATTVTLAGAGAVAATRSIEGNRVTLTPARKLLPLAQYEVAAHDFKGTRGELQGAAEVRRFSTADAAWQDATDASGTVPLDPASAHAAGGSAVVIGVQGQIMAAWATPNGVRVSRQAAAGAAWTESAVFTAGAGAVHEQPEMAMDADGNVLLVWSQHGAVWAARFDQARSSWDAPRIISSTGGSNLRPRISLRATGVATVAWLRNDPIVPGTERKSVWVVESNTGADAAWSEPRRVDDKLLPSQSILSVSIATSANGRRALAWASRTVNAGTPAVIWAKLLDDMPGGGSAARVMGVSDITEQSGPSVALDPAGNTYVAWLQPGAGAGLGGTVQLRVHDGNDWEAAQRTVAGADSAAGARQPRLASCQMWVPCPAQPVLLSWLEPDSTFGAAPNGRVRAVSMSPTEVGAPQNLATGQRITHWHGNSLVLDGAGNALAVWTQFGPQGQDHVMLLMSARHGASTNAWSAARMLADDKRTDLGDQSATSRLAIDPLTGDAVLGWIGVLAHDAQGATTSWKVRTRRFD